MAYMWNAIWISDFVLFAAFAGRRDGSGNNVHYLQAAEISADGRASTYFPASARGDSGEQITNEEAHPHLIPTQEVKITSFNLLSVALRTEPFEVDPPEYVKFLRDGGLQICRRQLKSFLEPSHQVPAEEGVSSAYPEDLERCLTMGIYHLIRTYMISVVNGNYQDYLFDTDTTGRKTLQKSMGITVQGLFMEPGKRRHGSRDVSFKEVQEEQKDTIEKALLAWNELTPVREDSVWVDRNDHRLRGLLLSTKQTFIAAGAASSPGSGGAKYAEKLQNIADGTAPLSLRNFYWPTILSVAFNPACLTEGASLSINSCPFRVSEQGAEFTEEPDVLVHWLNSNTLQWLQDDIKEVYKKVKRLAIGQANKAVSVKYKAGYKSLGNLQPFKCTETWADPVNPRDLLENAGQWFDPNLLGMHDWLKLRVYDLLTMAVRNRVLYTFYMMSYEEMAQDWPLLGEDISRLKLSHELLRAAGANRFELLDKLRFSACTALSEGSDPGIQANRLQGYVNDPKGTQPHVVLLQEADQSLWQDNFDGGSFKGKPRGYHVIWPDAMAATRGGRSALTTDNSAILINEEFLRCFFKGEEVPEFEYILRRPSERAKKSLLDLRKLMQDFKHFFTNEDPQEDTYTQLVNRSGPLVTEIDDVMQEEFLRPSVGLVHSLSPEMPQKLQQIHAALEKEFKMRKEVERRLLVKYESKNKKKILILGSVHFSSQAGEGVFKEEVKDYIEEVLTTIKKADCSEGAVAIFGGDLNVDPRNMDAIRGFGNLTSKQAQLLYPLLQQKANEHHFNLERLTSPGDMRRSYMKTLSPLQSQVTKIDQAQGGAIDHMYVVTHKSMSIKPMDAQDPWMRDVFEELAVSLDHQDTVEDIYTSASATGYIKKRIQLPFNLPAETKAKLGSKAFVVSSDHLPVNVHVKLVAPTDTTDINSSLEVGLIGDTAESKDINASDDVALSRILAGRANTTISIERSAANHDSETSD